MRRYRLSMALGIAALAALCRCSLIPLSAGNSSSETTNGIVTGAVYNSDGPPARDARVVLVPVLHNPVMDPAIPDSMTDTTDAFGRYALKTGTAGLYNIMGVSPASGDRLLITEIPVDKNDTTAAASGVLLRPSLLNIELPDYFDPANGYMYLPGTTLSARVQNGRAFIDSVPAGTVPALYYASRVAPAENRVMKTGFYALAGATVSIADYSSWKSYKKLYLNTTATGANVAKDVCGFPVLIRLSSANFNFQEAGCSGADIRFMKSDNQSPLPYEIELWDSANAAAAVWVRVDTVYGNDSSHCFTMFWGNRNAASVSAHAPVFDTSQGFEAVWHLGEAGNSTLGGYKDATPNGLACTGSPAMRNAAIAGAIGTAQRFSGDSTYISGPCPEKISGNASFTVSFWMNYSAASSRSWVLYFGGYQAELEMCHFLIRPDDTAQFGLSGGPAVPDTLAQNVFSLSQYTGAWSLVTTVYDAPAGTLSTFINGMQMDTRPVHTPNIIPSGGMHISRKAANHAEDVGYFGLLDELRLQSAPVSPDWIKLCYMNQKSVDALLRFK